MPCSIIWRTVGSSPHTRGTQPNKEFCKSAKRFIPAYAGNAVHGFARIGKLLVHPRIRGERRASRSSRTGRAGSSPHTRGTRRFYRPQSQMTRFIPAYAGNVSPCWAARRRQAVHPRIRGERDYLRFRARGTVGSSPHTRGTRYLSIGGWYGLRFIPAYAGNAHWPGQSIV